MSVFSQSLELSYLMISSSNGSITFLFRAPLGIYYKRGGISYQCPFLMCVCVCVRSVMSDSLRPSGCSLPGFSVCGIFQARILEWVASVFSSRVFLTQESSLHLLSLLHCLVDFLPLHHLGNPIYFYFVPKQL